MSHSHHHHHHGGTENLRAAFFLNLAFTLLEIVGGLWTNSVAILADAVHDLGDSLSLGLAWYLQHYSQRDEDETYTYGYRRFSLLGALVNALVLMGGSLLVLSEAIPRILNPEQAYAPGMIGFAVLGIVVNGTAVWRLRGEQTMNAQVVGWHLLEDVLGWTAVLVAGIVLLFVELPIIDPILAALFTLYVLYNVIGNLRTTLTLFLQAAPPNVDVAEIGRRFRAIEGVKSTHHTHLWSLDGDHHVLTTHLVLEEGATREDALRVKRDGRALVNDLHVSHVTLELEYTDEDCGLRPDGSDVD